MADEGLPRAPGVPVTEPSLCGYGVLLAALILGYAGVHVLLLLPALRGGLSDFGAFYYPAARAILAGRSPYVVAGLIYPPLLPFLILPVALLPATSARIVWFALSHLFAAVAGVRVWRGLRGGGEPLR